MPLSPSKRDMLTGILSKANALLSAKQTQSGTPQRTSPTAHFENSSGHQLAYDMYGQRSGYPLFFFHDAGSSRLEAVFFQNAARKQGFRLIAIDRPGIGCSEFYHSENSSDFCADVLCLAVQLELSSFGLMSCGAGGVYATTLAYRHPQAVKVHLNLAGIPGNVFNESLAQSTTAGLINEWTPALIEFGVRLRHALFTEDTDSALARMQEFLSYTDRKVLALPRIRQILAMDQSESIRNGARGVAQDLAMCYRKLDFCLQQVPVPTDIWQGSADHLAWRANCEYQTSRLPNARFFRVPNRGHFFFLTCMDEIFQRLRTRCDIQQDLAA